MPRYPVYVISKGRFENCLTAKFLERDGVDFRLVVEPQERDQYASRFGPQRILTLPFANLGRGSIPARNWVWEHSKSTGHERHWILDDNIYHISRRFKGIRIACNAETAFAATEDFVDRYENIAVAGMNYTMFMPDGTSHPPFRTNVHVYSCLLIWNDLPYRWRGRYNEDTDLCLQVLSGGWCTVLTNAFLIKKITTMVMKGGNSAELYKGDGRLKMARALERKWPGVVEVRRRFKRPQHVIKYAWRRFDTPLKLKPGINLNSLPPIDEYGLELTAVKPVKSESLKELLNEGRNNNGS